MEPKKKQERAIVHLEKDGQHYYYGNLKALTDHWSKDTIGVSYSYLKNLNISEDKPYRNDMCIIRRGVIITSVRTMETKMQPKEEKPNYDIRCSDGYAYFYMDVPLSNWWDSVPAIQYDGHTFNASESIFMYLKAKYFKDEETAAKIVEADNKTYDQPKKRWAAVKRLGKKVKNFDDKKWAGPNRKAMATALKQKALYDEEFKRVLLDPQYAGMTFCEASKYDQIWGIGIDANTAIRVGKAGWKGHNFLGRALTELRDELKGQALSE